MNEIVYINLLVTWKKWFTVKSPDIPDILNNHKRKLCKLQKGSLLRCPPSSPVSATTTPFSHSVVQFEYRSFIPMLDLCPWKPSPLPSTPFSSFTGSSLAPRPREGLLR